MFPGVEIILMSATCQRSSGIKVVGGPEEAIAYLTEKGFTEIAVGGPVRKHYVKRIKNDESKEGVEEVVNSIVQLAKQNMMRQPIEVT